VSARSLFIGMTVMILIVGIFNLVVGAQSEPPQTEPKTEPSPLAEHQRMVREAEASDKRFVEYSRDQMKQVEARLALEERVSIPVDKAIDLRDPVLSHYFEFDAWPYRFDQIDEDPSLWNRTPDEYSLGAEGRIRVEFGEPFTRGTSLTMTPHYERGRTTWTCSVMGDAEFEALVRQRLTLEQPAACQF